MFEFLLSMASVEPITNIVASAETGQANDPDAFRIAMQRFGSIERILPTSFVVIVRRMPATMARSRIKLKLRFG